MTRTLADVRVRGTVIWFNNAKGFGFIGRPGEADIFVHYSAICADGYKALNANDAVEFSIETTDEGRTQAVGVVKLGGNA